MLLSTKTQLILLLISIFVLLTASIGTYVLRHAETSLLDLQRLSINNTLHQAERNILSFQRILFTSKSAQAIAVKNILRRNLKILASMSQRAEDPLTFLRTFALPAELMLSVVDVNMQTLYQSPQLPTNLESLSDIKGRAVGSEALEATQDLKKAFFLVKTQKKSRQIHLYGEYFFLPKSGLLVGVWKDVTHLEHMYHNIYTSNLESLNHSFDDILFGQSGFLFVMNHEGRYVVGSKRVKESLAQAVTLEGAPLMEALTDDYDIQTLSVVDAEILKDSHVDKDDLRSLSLFALYVKPLNWYVIGILYEDAMEEPVNALFHSFMMALCAVMVCILPMALFILTRMTAPLSKLSHHVRTLPEQDFTQESTTDSSLEHLAYGSRSVEIRELAQSFLFMDSTLRKRVREIMRITSQRERVEGELAAAIEVQKSILPHTLPTKALAGRLNIGFTLIPAHEMGGDLYDFFPLDAHRLCFVIGDVSGKGMPSALFMSMAVTLIRSHAKADLALQDLIGIVNNNLAYENAACMFVTLCLGILDMSTGEITYINAGHNKPIILRNTLDGTTQLETLHGLSGLVVGAMEDVTYSPLVTRLLPGDALFLYTDGVTEAMNVAQHEYGIAALENTLRAHSNRAPQALIQHVLEDVAQHVQGAPAFDDITMLVMHWTGANSESSE